MRFDVKEHEQICANCGKPLGLHQAETNRCPQSSNPLMKFKPRTAVVHDSKETK